MLNARSAAGDAEQAQGLLDQALATYCELGMESHAARIAGPARDVSAQR